jgi:hypothetical protein
MYTSPDRTWVQAMYGVLRGETRGRRDVAWLGSGNLAIRRAAFEVWAVSTLSSRPAKTSTCASVCGVKAGALSAMSACAAFTSAIRRHCSALFAPSAGAGRDNVAVSLRGPLSWRDLPGLATPIFTLMGVALILMSPLVRSSELRRCSLPASGAIVVVGLALLKAIHIAVRARRFRPIFLLQAFVVTFVYHMARAVALITRAGHHRNR